MTTALTLKHIYAQVDEHLAYTREAVNRQWTDAFQLVYGPTITPPLLGGKLMRPALCFMSAGALGADDLAGYRDMATAMELLHLAALAHDDVVDRADTRRGETSLNRLWDNHTAVLGGDYLVARALDILTNYDASSIVKNALHSIHEMAEGELINFGRKQGELVEEDCIRLAEKKTASLFAVTCSTPALLHQRAYFQQLYDFGMGLGAAFQLIDDLLDLEQDEDVMGKPACGDLIEGKTTLPILYIKQAVSTDDIQRLESFTGKTLSDDDRAWVRDHLVTSNAHEKTDALARKYIEKAQSALAEVPPSSYTESMFAIADFVLLRDA